jgi:hypothetical protein
MAEITDTQQGKCSTMRLTAEREIERREELRKIWLELKALGNEQQAIKTKFYNNSQKTFALAQRVFDLIND